MKKINSILFGVIDIIVFMVIMLIKLIGFNYVIKVLKPTDFSLLASSLGSVLVVSSILLFFTQRKRLIAIIVTDILISIILIADIVYNRYFLDVTSVALLKQASLVGDVGNSVTALLKFKDAIFLVDIVLIIPLYKRIKGIMGNVKNIRVIPRIALVFALFFTGYILTSYSAQALSKEQPGILKSFYDKKYVVQRIGDLNFHYFDLYRYVTNNVLNKEKLTNDQVDSVKTWFETKNNTTNSKYFGSMKGKNLIVVQLEAFQSFVLNQKVNGVEITPNLNKLYKESMAYNNYYFQTAGGGTSDAEFLSNVSLYPVREGSVYYQYAGNTYDSIVSNLNDSGYYTAVMHANRPSFWNRSNMYSSLGFEKFDSQLDFNVDDVIGLGLSDKSFFSQAISKMKTFKQPFYTFMISLSSHFPFADSNGKLKDQMNVGEFEGTLMGDYLKSANYTDQAIGQLIDNLKKEGLWDNSVVVFYGDHNAIPYDKKNLIAKLVYNKDDLTPSEWAEAQKVVMMIHTPNEKIKGQSDIAAGQIDLYPTLANLFGIKPKYAIGDDLLNTKDGFIALRNGNWVNNNVIYVSSEDKLYDLKTQKELNKADYAEEFKKAAEYQRISDLTIEHNLIKTFKETENR